MKEQNYSNHRRFVPMYHFLLSILLLAALIISCVKFFNSLNECSQMCDAGVLVLLSLSGFILFWYARAFALRAQDRAIRAEENFRHFILTGKPLDSRLKMAQIISLRFAAESEFADLCRKAAEENIPAEEIKKMIKNWKADHDRA